MRRIVAVLLIWAAGLGPLPLSAASPPGSSRMKELGFFLGHWELETRDRRPDGTYGVGRATSHCYLTLDGTAQQDDYRQFDENGETILRGVTFRAWDAESGKWAIKWMMAGIPGFTDIVAERKGDTLVGRGKGYDPFGEFIERFRYFDITDDSFSFEMDRSYDGGFTWLERVSSFKARRSSSPKAGNGLDPRTP